MVHWGPWWAVIFGTFYLCSCLEEGPNVCAKQETYMTTIRVFYNKPYEIRTFTWCLAIPPRCSRYRIAYTTGYKTKPKINTRTVNACCKGFVLTTDESRCIPFCSNACIHGICVGPEECECQPGFGGPTCNVSCPAGKYGAQCERDCICQNRALCDPVTGSCSCKPGWQGSDCSVPCDEGFYGYRCEQECRCENRPSCDPISGACKCAPGYRGPLCSEPCPEGTHGESCTNKCECQNGGTCDHVTGKCSCLPGWMGAVCANPCSPGYYGKKCRERCICYNGASCHHLTGQCICAPGYRGERCQDECPIGKWRPKCANACCFTWSTMVLLSSGLASTILLYVAKCAVGAAMSVAVSAAILPALGFTASGVAAGSVAAGIHSSIGDVAAGSLFSMCQSAGAVGLGVIAKSVIGFFGSALSFLF